VIANDSLPDRRFYYAVQTTGIYCRPSCKSRVPSRDNVLFFDSAQAAEAAGFRPCKRCRPDLDNYQPLLELAQSVKEVIDRHFAERDVLAAKLHDIGVSPHRLTEVFKNCFGLTPGQYAGQLKIRRAKAQLDSKAAAIIDIAFALGFDSLSAFYAFFHKHTRMTPKEYQERGGPRPAANHIFQACYGTSFGEIAIAADGAFITRITFVADSSPLQASAPSALTDAAAKQLEEYFAGQRKSFALPLKPAGTAFQQRVWDNLLTIPYGKTRSYKEVAAALGNPKASRAVGMANNKNPLPIVIPCHRVVGANGALVGYAFGLPMKQRLLQLEQGRL
jgi:AraC family transcriptional regulator of adaptative response/methylated-DNA-[protein]-cysteine methyltransferase